MSFGTRVQVCVCSFLARASTVAVDLGQAEVDDLSVMISSDDDVLAFDIAMDMVSVNKSEAIRALFQLRGAVAISGSDVSTKVNTYQSNTFCLGIFLNVSS